jgi:hypothetical protein
MTDLSQAPTRLLDDPSQSELLRGDLQIASAHAPLPYDVAAGFERFEQATRAGAAGPSAGAASGLRVLGWIVGAAVLVSGGIGATWLATTPSTGARDHVGVTASADADAREDDPVIGATASIASQTPTTPAAKIETPAEPELAEPAPTPHAPAVQRPASKPATLSADPQPSLADEAKQINDGRKLLASDPARTLAIMQAAEQQFPDGAMIQERTGYTILALISLNRGAEAEQIAQTYLQRWPNGPLARRVRDALGQ